LLFSANTQWKRVRFAIGFGTRAASRAMKSGGSKMTCVVSSRYGVFSWYRTLPFGVSEPPGRSTYTLSKSYICKWTLRLTVLPKRLHQGDRAGLGRPTGKPGLLDQVRGGAAIGDVERSPQACERSGASILESRTRARPCPVMCASIVSPPITRMRRAPPAISVDCRFSCTQCSKSSNNKRKTTTGANSINYN
jgi:hypothetical protein